MFALAVPIACFAFADSQSTNPITAAKIEQMWRGAPAAKTLPRAVSPSQRQKPFVDPSRPQSSTQGTGSNFQPFFSAPYVSGAPSGNASGVFTSETGDFDHQNGPDVITVQVDGTLNVLFNNGQGNLSTTYTNTSAQAFAPTIAYIETPDLNNDGFADVVAEDVANSAFLVFLNHKDGTFADATRTKVAPASGALFQNGGGLTVADVDGDGKLDVVTVANLQSSSGDSFTTVFSQQMFRGNGDGTFKLPKGTDTTLNGFFFLEFGQVLALADMDHDRHPDLVIEIEEADTRSALIIGEGRGDGTGGFASIRPTGARVAAAGPPQATLKMADINGDSSPDALFIDRDSNVYVALGKNTGGLKPVTAVLSNIFGAYLLGLGDFDNDDRLDMIVYGFGQVGVFSGKGDGTFSPISLGQYSGSLGGDQQPAPADFNADGKLDFIWTETVYGKVSLFTNRGNGTFVAANAVRPSNASQDFPNNTEWGGNVIAVGSGDFNGDSLTDTLVFDFTRAANTGFADIDFGLSDGKGNFQFTVAIPGNQIAANNIVTALPTTGDFNGDHRSDVIFTTHQGLSVALANSDGTSQTPIVLNFPVPIACDPIYYGDVGDVNNDGNLDIVASYSQNPNCGPTKDTPTGIFVMLGDGTGHFNGTFTQFGAALYFIRLADFNGDGKLDITVQDLVKSGGVFSNYVIPGNGDGTFNTSVAVAQKTQEIISGIVTGDYNGDGRQDLTLLSAGKQDQDGNLIPGTEGAIVMPGNGDFTFGTRTLLVPGLYPLAGEFADFDHNGNMDLAVSQYTSSQDPVTNFGLTIVPGAGQGKFGEATSYLLPQYSGLGITQTMVGDFNGDGAPDVVVGNGPSSALFLNRNR
jgi:hypothetical protein